MKPDHRAPLAADLDRVVGAFDALMHRLMATHAPELSALDLTMSQTKAMYLVLATGPMRMSELAHRLGVTNSTATGQVDRLVELGLVDRHEDPADRRQVVVSATAHGSATLEQFRELNSRRMRELLAHTEAGDLTTIERAIRILDAAAAAEAADTDDAAPPMPSRDVGTSRHPSSSHIEGTRS
jgi:DNA-binding MarR family transcriptional regulator